MFPPKTDAMDGIDLQILHFNDRFVDLLLTLNPLLAPTYGITRYPDRVFSVSRTAHVQFFKGLLYLRTQVDKLAESLLTKKQKEEVKFLKSAIERSLVREGIPGDVGFVLELGNNHMIGELAMLEYWFSLQPTKTGQDLINHNTRLLLLPAQFTHMIENFNLGIKRQATLTKRCTELLIKTVHGLCRPDLPITQAAKLSGLNREKEAKDLLGSPDFFVPALVEVVQSLRGIKVYLETIYIQNARDMDGIGGIPGAEDAYRRYIYEFTDSYTSADEFHALGIAEVERIQKELEDVKEQCGYRGSLAQFQRDLMDRSKYPQLFLRTKKEVVEYCENVVKRNKEMMAGFFDEFPTLDCRVEAVAPELESQRPIASYYSGTDTTPGTFYINTHLVLFSPIHTLKSICLHETNPGHHHQGTLANANKSNHVIRKIMMSEPYLDGWALYSEYLGKEMGVYETPFEVFGKLTMEMLRACRLVVDTGMHAKGWSVEEAVEYMGSKVALSKEEVEGEVIRYCAYVGQALSYKAGELKIKELRSLAEREFGVEFSVKEFHGVILKGGALPLDTLEDNVRKWIQEKTEAACMKVSKTKKGSEVELLSRVQANGNSTSLFTFTLYFVVALVMLWLHVSF